LTISELTAAGLSAILVPYPSAVDDHQTRNGQYLEGAGAAVLIPQPEFTVATLSAELGRSCADREVLIERAGRARSLAKPQATEEVAAVCMALGKAA